MVTEEITYFYQNFAESRVDKLVYDFYKYPKIAIFGILNSDNGAKELQYNLIGWGKICIYYTNFQDQLDFIKSADSNTLIVIFSFSGNYVMKNGYSRFYHTYDYLKSSKAKVYVITKNNLVQELEYVNEVILVPIKHDLYNYTLQCLVDLIFMKYQKKFDKIEFPFFGNNIYLNIRMLC